MKRDICLCFFKILTLTSDIIWQLRVPTMPAESAIKNNLIWHFPMYFKLKYWSKFYKTQSCQIWGSVSRYYGLPYLDHEIPPLIHRHLFLIQSAILVYYEVYTIVTQRDRFFFRIELNIIWLYIQYLFCSWTSLLLFIVYLFNYLMNSVNDAPSTR